MTAKRFKQLLDKLNDERKKALLLELYESATFVERLKLIVITENYINQ
tara:strand:- start:451 stop:594 length:144 start_codon:yes stop_codon:yes gene_type:complete